MNELDKIIHKEVESIKSSLVRIKKVTKTVPRHKEDSSKECTIELYGTSLKINYNFSAGRPAQIYDSNGDPGHPEEPDEVEILSINCDDVCAILDFMDEDVKATKFVENFYTEVERQIIEIENTNW